MRRLALAALAAAVAAPLAPAAGAMAAPSIPQANLCVTLQSDDGARLAGPLHVKPTGLGGLLLYARDGDLVTATRRGTVERHREPGRLAEWTLAELRPFRLAPTRGCRHFPEAHVGAVRTGARPFRSRDGVYGFADLHLHITADMRAGGRVIHGRAFDRFGITRALGGDARTHGADGSLDITGNLLRTGIPFGTHDTEGWPGFTGWPTHDTNTHQQVYYAWLERVWRAGLRLVVAQTVEDEPICRLVPRRAYRCRETEAIARQVRRLRALEEYVDAQSGGRGRGWFRLVYGPGQARRVIERGKLAVVIGAESSNPFGCSVRLGLPRCTRRDVDRGIDRLHRLGVRSLFLAHWVDNALAGAALEGGLKGTFINVFNRFQTGRYFRAARCPRPGQGEEVHTLSPFELGVLADLYPAAAPLADEGMPDYPPGRLCNPRGLTALGRYAVARLMDRGMLIEADHLSERARDSVLALAARRRYPLVSGHTNTGGTWTAAQLHRLYAAGGIAAARLDTSGPLARTLGRLARYARDGAGVPLGTDVGGFASLPGARQDAARAPLRYPFRLAGFRFARQRTGTRVFDLNQDGVAHYGLVADLVADLGQRGHRRVVRLLFGSAEAYLRMWSRAG